MSGFLLSILLAQAASPGPATENPLRSDNRPLRAPLLASLCATPDDAELRERRTSFCAGFVTAVLENDPRLDHCSPFRAQVMDEIIRRQRTAPQTDRDVLARDFVVAIARDLCRRPPS